MPHEATPGAALLTGLAVIAAIQRSEAASGQRHANLAGDATYQPAGWNHVYGAWSVNVDDSNSAALNVAVESGMLLRPLFVFNNYTAAQAPTLMLNGSAVKDCVMSIDPAGHKVWVTLLRDLTGKANALTLK